MTIREIDTSSWICFLPNQDFAPLFSFKQQLGMGSFHFVVDGLIVGNRRIANRLQKQQNSQTIGN
jgi:hypothetical protein